MKPTKKQIEEIRKHVKNKVRSNRILSMVVLAATLLAFSNLIDPMFSMETKIFSVFMGFLNFSMFCSLRRVANKEVYIWSTFIGDTEGIAKRIGREDERKDLPFWEQMIVSRLIIDVIPREQRVGSLAKFNPPVRIPIWNLILKDPVRLIEWIISSTCYKLWTFRRCRFLKFAGDKTE